MFPPFFFSPAALVALLTAASLTTAAPNGYGNAPKKPHCESKHPKFTLNDITYSSQMIYSTPAHLAVAEGTVTFNLSNSAVSYVTHCAASSSRGFGFFFGDQTFNCDAVPNQPVADAAVFTFSEPDGTFKVNATWVCDEAAQPKPKGGGKKETETMLASGSGAVKLDCLTDSYQNPNWQIGEIYSRTTVTCKPAQLVIKATGTEEKKD